MMRLWCSLAAASRLAAASGDVEVLTSDSLDTSPFGEVASGRSPGGFSYGLSHDDDDDDEDRRPHARRRRRSRRRTTTSTHTTTTHTTTTRTTTTRTTTTSTSTTGPHVFGGAITREVFYGWLSVWRSKYQTGVWNADLSDPWESLMPEALKGIPTMVVESTGGAAGGVVTEGMGYGIMVEGFLAAGGNATALNMSLSMIKSWLTMVNGPPTSVQPLGGGMNATGSSTQVNMWPYGVSVVEWSIYNTGPAGVPAWKFPINASNFPGRQGSATDGDQDAILGMVYTAKALGYPADFVDIVIRSIIAFTSADLGFPDLYRTLPGGEKVYVTKLGSMWGGLLAKDGKYKTTQQAWCYSPGYFAPAHYRTFRDFLIKFWKPAFDDYLPPHEDGYPTTLEELVEALDSTIVSGYNLLYYSSCSSGTVSNWIGVKAPCENENDLNCPGVPWAYTPYIGAEGGNCSSSGTRFGSFGADASRTAWRVALDYVLYADESRRITVYDRFGYPYSSETFGAQKYLNRIVVQYATRSICNGGVPGDCFHNTSSPFRLAYAYDLKFNATDMTCPGVPHNPESWWAGFMAYPTFTAFVAPYDEIGAEQMTNWMDTFASICNFSDVNFLDFKAGGSPKGAICVTSYFEASQAVISLLIMSGFASPLLFDKFSQLSGSSEKVNILKDDSALSLPMPVSRSASGMLALGAATSALVAAFAAKRLRGRPSCYAKLSEDVAVRRAPSNDNLEVGAVQ